jgi:hypothetical protein
MQGRPVNAMVAIGVALLVWPALWLLDRMNRGCGDGLCGFFSGLLILGALAAVTAVFVMRSARRGETPGLLRWVPMLLWLVVVVPLVR